MSIIINFGLLVSVINYFLLTELTTTTRYSATTEGTAIRKTLTPLFFHHDVKADHNGNISAPRNKTLHPNPDKSLAFLFKDLIIDTSFNPENIYHYRKQKYILPTLSNTTQKKILDPEVIQHRYELPTFYSAFQEKLTPGLESIVPKIDPDPLQRVVDEGSLPLIKISMPYLLRIRRHKMKKHKLKKFRKRMIFLHRKLSEIKKRKKEQQLVEFQQKWSKRAVNFDPEKQLEDHLLLARKGGYGVPLFPGKTDQ